MKPIYVSLTTIYQNQDLLYKTLHSLLQQTKKPDKIYLHLSQDPYILDEGFKDKTIDHRDLEQLIGDHDVIEVVWVENTGPYRKLLPLLKAKWEEDCCIITVDDDHEYHHELIQNLYDDYCEHECVVSYRGFTPASPKIRLFDYRKRADPRQTKCLVNFSTNGAGTLWKPQFFHKTGQLIFNKEIYLNVCSKQDDIWFYVVRCMNHVPCFLGDAVWQAKDNSAKGLWNRFNQNNNNNTRVFRKLVQYLEDKNILVFKEQNLKLLSHRNNLKNKNQNTTL